MRADHKTWVVSCSVQKQVTGSHRKACRLPFITLYNHTVDGGGTSKGLPQIGAWV